MTHDEFVTLIDDICNASRSDEIASMQRLPANDRDRCSSRLKHLTQQALDEFDRLNNRCLEDIDTQTKLGAEVAMLRETLDNVHGYFLSEIFADHAHYVTTGWEIHNKVIKAINWSP